MNLGADAIILPYGLTIKVTTKPTEAAALISNAVAFARIDTSLDDSLINDLMESATQKVEAFLNFKLIHQTITANWEVGSSAITLPYGNVQSITSVEIGQDDGTFVAATYVQKANTIYFDDAESASSSNIRVVYVTGLSANHMGIDAVIKEAIYKLILTSYDNRENFVVGESVSLSLNNWKNELRQFVNYESF